MMDRIFVFLIVTVSIYSFIHVQHIYHEDDKNALRGLFQRPGEHVYAFNDTLWIASTIWNDPDNFKKSVASIRSQAPSFSNIHHIVYEDYSSNQIQRDMYPHVVFLQTPTEQRGAAYGKWQLFDYIRQRATPNDMVIVIDGDDILADAGVFKYIWNETYHTKDWFMWGKINGKFSEQCGPKQRGSNIRRAKWSVCHPRIFSAHLLNTLTSVEFKRDNGEWLQKATDRPFIYSFIEQAGDDRIHFLNARGIYNYTWTYNNGLKRFSGATINGDKELINNRKSKQVTLMPITVIVCMWKKRSDEDFLTTLMQSDTYNHQINVHICNNAPEMFLERKRIAKKLNTMYNHTITIHDMGTNLYGYGRFILAKKLLRQIYLDYVIMIDDDQYVRKDTIYNVYRSKSPMTFNAWYGKNWELDALHKANYWKPKHTMCVNCPTETWKNHLPNVETWQYGGTGMSIIDAAAFKLNEIYNIDDKYMMIEDMWLSFVLHKNNFSIGRLRVEFDVKASISNKGQWTHLKQLKQDFFTELNYLQTK